MSKFGEDPLCPLSRTVTAVHLLSGVSYLASCPWELSTDMPVSLG